MTFFQTIPSLARALTERDYADPTPVQSAVLAPEAAGTLVRNAGLPWGGIDALTRREREVLAELAKGRSNREIARALHVSEKTVKAHVSAILAKLGVQDRTQAALLAVRHEQAT